jgi:hypothetical protein
MLTGHKKSPEFGQLSLRLDYFSATKISNYLGSTKAKRTIFLLDITLTE